MDLKCKVIILLANPMHPCLCNSSVEKDTVMFNHWLKELFNENIQILWQSKRKNDKKKKSNN